MFLGLTRPSRSADLQLDRHRYKPEGVEFLPLALAKQSCRGRVLREFFSLLFRTMQICAQWKHSGNMNLQQLI